MFLTASQSVDCWPFLSKVSLLFANTNPYMVQEICKVPIVPIGQKFPSSRNYTKFVFSALEWNVNFEQSYKLIQFLIFILFNYIECQSHGLRRKFEENILTNYWRNNYVISLNKLRVLIHTFFAQQIVDSNFSHAILTIQNSVLDNAN